MRPILPLHPATPSTMQRTPGSSSFRKRVSIWLRVVTSKAKAGTHIKRKNVERLASPPTTVPYVPPEVWGLVIEQACLLYHDPLDTSQELSFLESSATQFSTYRAATKMKISLSLVSRQWNALTRNYLYEFVWISRAAQAKALAHTLLLEYVAGHASSGSLIRRLHIETPVLERCAPVDLRTILDFAPSLCIYSDHHSLQRSLYSDTIDPRCSPEAILKLVAHPKMRCLSWTSYGDVPFQKRMSPLLSNLATHLEYLELSSYSPNLRTTLAQSAGQPKTRETHMNVRLPSLRALKVSLDNNTFAVLASWDMPLLTNLSVLSADFSYAGPGFASFFEAHGTKLRQLELGHSSSLIEEHYLTAPQHLPSPTPIPLADWCPNLREFICSANAEWHWQSPDWIAPHILLPGHPGVQLIGIRDINTRLWEDPDFPAGEPYFPLSEQLSSLLRVDAFPALRFVRDLSAESDLMRRVHPHPRVLQFWMRIIEKCRERGVWCEDYRGVNLTTRSLLRASLGSV